LVVFGVRIWLVLALLLLILPVPVTENRFAAPDVFLSLAFHHPCRKDTEPSVGSGMLNDADPGMTTIPTIQLSSIPVFTSLVK